ncbi:hypothetical protein CDL15_Pgr012488 [Punica granatum]|uniref:Uncharacterized protein n=1 Tax=Punica granatum TaxID=22663 RepID=A0A218WVK3_PUNGR|nr:hypothetical protein CDL15_Pgr012488 [Punica granatum]PKI73756.1 hypothetical protein CRG98_005860 [Punica granatum]
MLGRTRDVGPKWAELLGWTCEESELGRGWLAGGRSGSPGTAAMRLRAAVLAPGRRGEGQNGRR